MSSMNKSCEKNQQQHIVKIFYMWMFCITLKGRNTFVFGFCFLRSETREKKNRQYIYIVENIKFIYTSFDEFFLPVSITLKGRNTFVFGF
jgi:hypothetical protein